MEVKKEWNDDLATLRGFAMMWVIFIHCLYWPQLFATGTASAIKSLLLIEMPLFFFIAGASNAMGRKRTVTDFYITRLQRILLPYWIYSIICIVLNIATQKLAPPGQTTYLTASLPAVFTPVSHLRYLTDALWFVPVYLYVIILFPLFKWYYDKYERNIIKAIPLLLLAVMVCIITFTTKLIELYDIKMILFYSFWVYMGLFFGQLDKLREFKQKTKVIPLTIVCMVAVALLVLLFHQSANMQYNKFPPNIVFLLYTFGALSFVYLFFKQLILFINLLMGNPVFSWVFNQYKQNGYSIFLFHPLAFLCIAVLLKLTGLKAYIFRYQLISLILYILIIIPSGAIIGKLFSWCERIKVINR